MKRLLTIVLAIVLIESFMITTYAQANPEAKPAPTTAAPEKKIATKTFKGELVRIDSATKIVTAKDGKGETTFDGAGIKKLAEFKAGEKIMIVYSEQEGKNVAKTIVKQATKKEAQKKEEARQNASSLTEHAKPAEPAKQ